MTKRPVVASAYPGYATPTFKFAGYDGHRFDVIAQPWDQALGFVVRHPSGWTAISERDHYVGLFPDKQAAGEALVRHAGYEVLG